MRSADLIAGALAGAACAPLLWPGRRWAPLVPPLLGVTLALALVARDQAGAWLVLAAALAAGVSRAPVPSHLRLGAAGAVALAVAWQAPAGLDDLTGAAPALAAGVLLAGLGATRAADADPVLPAGLLTLGALGAVLAVADTEAAAVVAAGLAVGALVVAVGARLTGTALPPLPGAWVGPVATVCWAMAWGARGRPLGLPGGLACLGVLAVLLAVASWRDGRLRPVALVAVQGAAVLAGSRWATRAPDAAAAWGRALLVLVAVAALVALVGIGRRRAPDPEVS